MTWKRVDMGVLPVSEVEFSCTIYNIKEDPDQWAPQTCKTTTWRKCSTVYSEIQSES